MVCDLYYRHRVRLTYTLLGPLYKSYDIIPESWKCSILVWGSWDAVGPLFYSKQGSVALIPFSHSSLASYGNWSSHEFCGFRKTRQHTLGRHKRPSVQTRAHICKGSESPSTPVNAFWPIMGVKSQSSHRLDLWRLFCDVFKKWLLQYLPMSGFTLAHFPS